MRCLMFAVTVAATSGLAFATGLTNTWTGAAHDGDWSNPQNFRDTSFAPGADDVVAIDEGCPAEIDASSASWERLNALRQVYPNGKDAQLIVTVPEGLFVTNDCPLTKRNVSDGTGAASGNLVKRGLGTMELGAIDKCRDTTSCHSFSSLTVEEGVLMMCQHCGNLNFSLLNVHVADGATFYTAAQNGSAHVSGSWAYTTVYGTLTGSGTITNQGLEMPLRFIGAGKLDYDGHISGGIRLMLGPGVTAKLRGTESDFHSSNAIASEGNVRIEIAKFGNASKAGGDPSSMGTNTKFEVSSNDRIVYTGTGERMFKSLIVRSSPVYIDAGATGGLDIDGSDWSGYYLSSTVTALMQNLVLDGSNTVPCVFHPYIRYWSDAIGEKTNCTFYISKQGAGTWHLKENAYSDWRGGTGVDNGTLQFSSLDETGKRCSFGYGTDLYDAYCGLKDDAHKVDYSIRLGNGNTTGTLEYIGDSFVNVSTRPIAVKGSGRLVNSSNRRIRIRNVSGLGEGENEFILDGTNVTQDTIENITNGSGALSVVKRGSGSWILGGEQTFEGDLRVEGGTLTVTDSKRYTWFKWTIRQVNANEVGGSGNNYAVSAAQFALYDKDGEMVTRNMAVHGATPELIHGDPDYLTLKPHSAQIGRWDYKYDNPALTSRITLDNANLNFTWLSAEHMHLERLFDDTPARYAWGDGTEIFSVYSRGSVLTTNPKVWVSVFMRTKLGTSVKSYDWAAHDDGGHVGHLPTCWTLQGSVNGFDWVDLDTRDHVALPNPRRNGWSYHEEGKANTVLISGEKRQGYLLPSSGPANPPDVLTKVRSVYVAPGATLEADGDLPAIASLKTDTAGLGSIVGFTFAEEGSLDISGNLKGKRAEIPFGFANVESSANIAGWTLKANGQLDTHHTLTIRDGKFVIEPTGLTVIIR